MPSRMQNKLEQDDDVTKFMRDYSKYYPQIIGKTKLEDFDMRMIDFVKKEAKKFGIRV